MEGEHNDHRAGAVGVQAAKECSAGDLFGDIGYAGMRGFGGGRVIQRERDTGDDLKEKDQQEPGAEDVSPSSAARNGLVEHHSAQSSYTRAHIQPIERTTGQPSARLHGILDLTPPCWT